MNIHNFRSNPLFSLSLLAEYSTRGQNNLTIYVFLEVMVVVSDKTSFLSLSENLITEYYSVLFKLFFPESSDKFDLHVWRITLHRTFPREGKCVAPKNRHDSPTAGSVLFLICFRMRPPKEENYNCLYNLYVTQECVWDLHKNKSTIGEKTL